VGRGKNLQKSRLDRWSQVLYEAIEVEGRLLCSRYLEGIVEKDARVVFNARVLRAPLTGVQRYTLELLRRFGDKVQAVTPKKDLFGIQGHLWEQLVLPYHSRGKLLFSPAGSGPLSVARQVVTIHDVAFIDHPEGFNPKFRAFYRFLVPRLALRVRAVITVSAFSRERLIEWAKILPSHVHAIHLGVDQRFSPQQIDSIERLRNALKIPSPYYILSLGAIVPRKNLPRLLAAWERIQRELPQEVWLVVAGEKGKSIIFNDVKIQKLPPRVHLTGRVADEFLPTLYSGALAFVYPSLYEGFGLPLLEAMACGTPVLTSNVTAMPEVVGDAGLLVDPYDVEAIAHGIRRLVEDSALREELRKKGLERAKQFTWERTAELTWTVLEEAMES
jgi:glycosyltransferase involved in cell wall biosynthesis